MIMKKRSIKKITAFMMLVVFVTSMAPLDSINAMATIKKNNFSNISYKEKLVIEEKAEKEETFQEKKVQEETQKNSESDNVPENKTGGVNLFEIEKEEIFIADESDIGKTIGDVEIKKYTPGDRCEAESERSTQTDDSALHQEETQTDMETEAGLGLSALDNKDFIMIKNSEKFDYYNEKYCYVVDFSVKSEEGVSLEQTVNLRYKVYKTSDTNLNHIGTEARLLYQGEINIGEGIENSSRIQYGFDSAGTYEIGLYDTQDNYITSLNYNIGKKKKKIDLVKSAIDLKYGEKADIKNLIKISDANDISYTTILYPEYLCEFDISLESEKDKNILNTVICDKNDCKNCEMCNYVEAIGMNNNEPVLVKIKLKETGFIEESKEVKLKVNVKKLKPEISINTVNEVNAYENLNVGITITDKGKDITKKLLKDKAFIAFNIELLDMTAQVNPLFGENNYIDSRKLKTNEKGEYIIPVTAEYFNTIGDISENKITATLMYDEDEEAGIYSPFDFVSSYTKISVKGSRIGLSTTLEKNGQFEYRFDYGKTANLTVTVEDVMTLDNNSVINYQITSSKTDIIDKKDNKEYTNKNNIIPLAVKGVGTADLLINAEIKNNNAYVFGSKILRVNVSDSSFFDEDIVVVYEPKGNTNESIQFASDENGAAIEKWNNYLEEHNLWVNGVVQIKLSDIGKQYYDKVCINNGDSIEEAIIKQSSSISEYIIWTEHTTRNANTSKADNGTRSFTMGIDTEGPVSEALSYSQNYFEPTKTDKCQYYASDFVITGSFSDGLSGVSKIEYTTNYIEEQNLSVWTEIEIVNDNSSKATYSFTLGNGDYKAIAIRAYDNAGNSTVVFLKNNTNEFINIIVDDSEPKINVEAYADGIVYDGENENWTNKAVNFNVSCNKEETGIAGIYSCEYAYKTIFDCMNGNTSYEWKTLEVIDDKNTYNVSKLIVGKDNIENKNGYYYFQAVSRSGVKTAVPVKKRILLQQKMSEKKPVIITGVSKTYNNEWYNKQSGTPIIGFEYPDYDNGNTSGEYEAPVILHYNLSVQDENGNITELKNNATAMKGVNKKEDFENGRFNVTEDNLRSFKVDFGLDKTTGYAKDGIYTLEYWISDKAANETEKESLSYKIDCHEPTQLMVKIDQMDMAVDSEETIVYQSFYQKSVKGSSSAEYGISAKGSLKILKAKKIGEWNTNSSFEDGEQFEISANNRCFIYVEATDKAGNKAEGWTRGVVVDDLAPAGDGSIELVLEPKGANEHGFYNKDIEVEVRIKDTPDNDDCAALMNVSSSVGKDGNDTITQKELFSFTKEFPTNQELTAAQSFSTMQVIDAKANESNSAYIDVTATDRSNNKKTSTQLLKIDVTKPQIDITFDNNSAFNESYFNDNRVATIHINELNFNSEYVNVEITKDGLAYEPVLSEWIHKESEHYASIVFAEDGNYTLSVSCKDLADNESEIVCAEAFIIDKTLPKADIRLEGSVNNEMYYNSQVKAIITITEHNFDDGDFRLKLADSNLNIKISDWTHKDDIHTAQAVFNNDGIYKLVCEYTDMAGNSQESLEAKEFVVDTVLPQIKISGVTDGSANSGDVTPVITIIDLNTNQDGTNISVRTGNGELVYIEKTVEAIENEGKKGYKYILNDMTSKEDNIYYLEVNSKDKAGNEDELIYRFSLNRNGSTYDINDFKRLKENYYNSYLTMEDLVIYEMNVDRVEDFNIFISRNGEMLSGKQVVLESDIDALIKNKQVAYSTEVSGNEKTGYTYKYTIYKENFASEGTYRMGLYSKDKAGNEVNNTLEVNGEDICFVIDATQPKVVIEGIESGKIYDTTEQTVNVMVSDNFKLNEAEFVLVNSDGNELQSWNYYDFAENEGDIVTLTIPQYNEEISLIFRAKDAAGNEILTLPESKTAVSDMLITTDKWVQMINKPAKTPLPLILIAFISGILLLQGCMSYMASKRGKK